MHSQDLEHIQGRIDEDNDSPKEALRKELELCGLDIKNVFELELNMRQLREKKYIEIYLKIVCDFYGREQTEVKTLIAGIGVDMCDKCKRCWFDSCSGLYICGFWSSDELVAIDSVPSESFEENGTCNFFEE